MLMPTGYENRGHELLDELKSQLQKVIAISEECPEPYREKCFEILWGQVVHISLGTAKNAISNETNAAGASRNGVETTDQFLKQYSITEDEWQQVFHRDGQSWTIIATDLKEKAKSKSQAKIALLLGAISSRDNREGIVERQALIDITTKYGVYDSANFSKYMKSQKGLFVDKGKDWQITVRGLKSAAQVIKELGG